MIDGTTQKLTSGLPSYISIFLTVMFLIPLFRAEQMQPKFKQLAIRTLMCASSESVLRVVMDHNRISSATGISICTSTVRPFMQFLNVLLHIPWPDQHRGSDGFKRKGIRLDYLGCLRRGCELYSDFSVYSFNIFSMSSI
jgi:hypothetical protein